MSSELFIGNNPKQTRKKDDYLTGNSSKLLCYRRKNVQCSCSGICLRFLRFHSLCKSPSLLNTASAPTVRVKKADACGRWAAQDEKRSISKCLRATTMDTLDARLRMWLISHCQFGVLVVPGEWLSSWYECACHQPDKNKESGKQRSVCVCSSEQPISGVHCHCLLFLLRICADLYSVLATL